MRIIASGIEKYDPDSYDEVAMHNMTAPSRFIFKIKLFCAAITLSAATMQNLLKCIYKSLCFLSFPLIEWKAFDLLKHTIRQETFTAFIHNFSLRLQCRRTLKSGPSTTWMETANSNQIAAKQQQCGTELIYMPCTYTTISSGMLLFFTALILLPAII